MSFYRKITRERTLCSFKDFCTADMGLKQSFSSFTKPPRQAVFYKSFEIQNDYYSKTGVNAKNKNEKPANDVHWSDSDKSNMKKTRTEGLQDDEKYDLNDKKLLEKSWETESITYGINSSYRTNVSSTIDRDKERYEVMNEDLESNFSKAAEVETSKSFFSERSNESSKDNICR